jgi:hypothetical protein
MAGSLTIPNSIGGQSGPTVAGSLFDANWTQIAAYVNAREIVLDIFANRPAAGTAGRWFFATDTGILYADNGAAWTQVALGTLAANLAETLTGLGITFVNGTSVTVGVGACTSDDAAIANRVLMSQTAAITGTTAGTFVVGTNQGKLDAGAIGNNQWWHVFSIKRVDTGVVDILFSLSPTAPTLPANYTKQRRIGAFKTDGAAAILSFVQFEDEFLWSTAVLDIDITNPGTAAVLRTLTVPTGIQVWALFNFYIANVATNFNVYFSSPDQSDQAASITVAPLGQGGTTSATAANYTLGVQRIRTNTSAQVRSRFSASGAGDILRMATLGWIDRRGRG